MLTRLSVVFIGGVTAIVLITAVHAASTSHSGSLLPDRLPSRESADFALAGERAELEPSYRKRGLGLDFEGAEPNSHFYTWTVVPSWGEGVVFFAIDRRTGDVWRPMGCGLVRSKELSTLQAHFRRRFGVPAWRVRQIEKQGFPGYC